MKKIGWMMALAALLTLLCMAAPALAEEAKDITSRCSVRVSAYGKDKEKMLDNGTMSMWYQPQPNAWVEITCPEGQEAQGVFIRWGKKPVSVKILLPGEGKNEWVDAQEHEGVYYNEYIAFDTPLKRFRIRPKEKQDEFGIIKLQVLGQGELPDWVEQWQPFEGKADLMVLVAHPDDELLFMGGVIPYYNTQMGKKVIVVYIAQMNGFRKVELLNGLWHCGVRMYPELPGNKFRNEACTGLKKCLRIWNEKKLLEHVTALIRKYQPDVIVTHDEKGEYGHGAHKACCYAVQRCVERAAKADSYPDSAKEYGVWQVKKAYIHLYKGELGQIDFDWRQPLSAFDGKNAFEIATEAFNLHRSQAASGKYVVKDYGRYDNSLFGLFYSTVGPDTGANDLFEHLE